MGQVTCTGCGARYQVPSAFAGLRFRCKHCGSRFTAPGQRARLADLPPWMRLSEIDPGMIAQAVDQLRQPGKNRKSKAAPTPSPAERRWQQLLSEMYRDATGPPR